MSENENVEFADAAKAVVGAMLGSFGIEMKEQEEGQQ